MLPELENYYQNYYLINCSQRDNFFESPKFLRFSSWIIFAITTPVNLFGIYCIVFKSPIEMLTIKWCMLYLHVLSTFTTFWLTICTVPYVFFPICAGFSVGILHAPIEIQAYVAVGCLGMLGLSLPILFENRQRYLVECFKITRPLSRTLFYNFNIFFVPITLFGLFSMVPEQSSARQTLLLEILPCPSQYYFSESVFVLSLNHIPITLYLCALSLIISIQVTFFGAHSLFYLARGIRKVSTSTRKLQRRFFLVISVQLTIPCLLLLVPVVYFIFSMLTGYYNQALNNIGFLTMSMYSVTATLALIFLHNPYKEFLLSVFRCGECSEEPFVLQVEERKWVRRNAVTITTPVSF